MTVCSFTSNGTVCEQHAKSDLYFQAAHNQGLSFFLYATLTNINYQLCVGFYVTQLKKMSCVTKQNVYSSAYIINDQICVYT